MMVRSLATAASLFLATTLSVVAKSITLPLYPDGQVPHYRDVGETEIVERGDLLLVSKVQTPTIEVFLPDPAIATGEAVVICPGGGYWVLAYELEGTEVAQWWADRGIAGIVLKYRLPTSAAQIEPRLSPLLDAERAMRLVRSRATDWHIDPDRVGIMGFSAGGHLAATLSTQPSHPINSDGDPIDRLSSRPDFSILVYPVISMSAPFAHAGSRLGLLGENPAPKYLRRYSAELQVTPETPPAILIHAEDDEGVPPDHSHVYAEALRAQNIPAEVHLYPSGGHGFGLATGNSNLKDWIEVCHQWLVSQRE